MGERVTITVAQRQAALARANHVRLLLERFIDDLSDPDREPSAGGLRWIDLCYRKMFKNDGAHPWLMFVRCIDHASRYSLVSPIFSDSDRAKIARNFFRADYADLDEMLDDVKVIAAVEAWRTRKNHWVAMHTAVLDFNGNAPDPSSMKRQWRDFPHLEAPRKAEK